MVRDEEQGAASGAAAIEARLRALAVREGMTLARFAARGEADRTVLRSTLARRFEPGRAYTEREVNQILRDWLCGVGAMLETDHVNLRRLLVDTALLWRRDDCSEYRLGSAAPALDGPPWNTLDPDRIAADARAGLAARRAARREAWANRADGPAVRR